MNHAKLVRNLLAWFAGHARALPWRSTSDPYAIWVSEIMLQQTQVKTVLRYWLRWMRELPDVKALARAKPERIHKLWEGLGYYTRVRNLQEAARSILEQHGGEFPKDYSAVLALRGVGRYTAGAICSIAFNQPIPVLDGNVIRVLTRVFGIGGAPRAGKTNSRLWQLAEDLVKCAAKIEGRSNILPRSRSRTNHISRRCSAFNQSLMELGALVCTPKQPQCGICPIAEHCFAYRENRIRKFPSLGRRPPASPRHFAAFVVQNGSRFLVGQRPAGVVNAHLWEFPNLEIKNGARDLKAAAKQVLGATPCVLEPLFTIKHSITRYRITLDVFRIRKRLASGSLRANVCWLRKGQLRRLPFASAHRKILRACHAL